jgi:hypothetical protein
MERKEAIQDWQEAHKAYIAKLIAGGEDPEVVTRCKRNPLLTAERARKLVNLSVDRRTRFR